MTSNFRFCIAGAIIVSACAVPPCLADPIFMSAGADRVSAIYLIFGNLVAAIFESLVIANVFKTPLNKTLLWMILANYFSTFAGYISIDCLVRLTGATLLRDFSYNLPFIFFVLLSTSFFLAVLYEWPFLFKLFTAQENTAKRALYASLLAQSISYSILVPCYLLTADTRLFQKQRHDAQFLKSNNVVVYFIEPLGPTYKLTLPGLSTEKVPAASGDLQDSLSVKYVNSNTAPHWQLWKCDSDHIPHLILENIGNHNRLVQGPEVIDVEDGVKIDFLNGSNNQLLNRVGKHYWADVATLKIDIPFMEPAISPAYLLPHDQAIFVGDLVLDDS